MALNVLIPHVSCVYMPIACSSYEAEGHDLQSLLYAFLDELLFVFNTELFACKRVVITSFDQQAFRITAQG